MARAFIKPNPDGAWTLEPLPCGFNFLRSKFHSRFSQKSDASSPQLGQLSGQTGVRIDCKSHQPQKPFIAIDDNLLPAV